MSQTTTSPSPLDLDRFSVGQDEVEVFVGHSVSVGVSHTTSEGHATSEGRSVARIIIDCKTVEVRDRIISALQLLTISHHGTLEDRVEHRYFDIRDDVPDEP